MNLQLHFKGLKEGKRLNRSHFKSHGGFLETLENSSANKDFLKALGDVNIGQRKKPKKTQQTQASFTYDLNEMETPQTVVQDEIQYVAEKYVGKLS